MLSGISSKLTSVSVALISLHLICLVQSRNWDYSADAFTSMGDVDWGKRNLGSTLGKRNVGSALRSLRAYRSPYKRYESPAWAYSSMADTDWGWKKRSEDPAAELYDIYRNNKLTSDYWKRYGQSYYQPYSSYNSYQPYQSLYQIPAETSQEDTAPRTASLKGPVSKNSNVNKDRQYAFHSMADMDWGWKRKRSMQPPLVDYQDEPEILEKKNLGSFKQGKRADEQVNEDTDQEISAAKKTLASVARTFYPKRRQRGGGIAALARQGVNTNQKLRYFT